ncbi:MAG: ATP-binding protein [Bacteroidales bacterium]
MNPFSYGTIVRGDNFYDRREECARIVETLSGGNNLVLYAPRRFGKTSLVFRAIEQLEARGFICVYFDFMPVYSPESFVRLYAKALSVKQTNLNRFVQLFASIVKSLHPVLSFGQDGLPEFSIDFANAAVDETTVSQLLDMPESLAGGDKRVIVFFDEFQEIEKMKTIHFESLLRSKVQQQQKTNYLFFGSKTHLLKEMFNDKRKAFYNAVSQMSIGNLPQKDTIHFLQTKFAVSGIVISEEIAKYLIAVTADIPHYIQLLSAEIWQYMINSQTVVTREIVDECSKRVLIMKGDYYMELFDRQSQSRKQLLKAITVSGENIFSSAYTKRHCLPAAASLQRALKGLIDDGMIEKTHSGYFIADPFFKLFVSGL